MADPIKGVLFDLDNTLLDRNRVFAAWAQWFARERLLCANDADVEECAAFLIEVDGGGYTPRDVLFQRLKERHPSLIEEVDLLVEAFRDQLVAQITGLDESPAQLLDALGRAGVPWGIVTNGAPSQLLKIRGLGIERHATCILVSEMVGMRKPDPAIFHAAAAELGVAPQDILFVGDNPEADIVGAMKAGMQTAWIRCGKEWPAEFAATPPQHTVDSLHELISLIEGDR
jgi:HAD superfamily hydrolase (TIGR01549 family)